MKELIKKRWFVFLLGILIAVIALLIFGLILYCNGYRIVYPEQFETSWDAVSGFAEWAGVTVSLISVGTSFVAVWAAIQVPKEIAKKQDAISLFEKRYELYSELHKWYYLAEEIIKLAYSTDEARGVFDVLYNDISGDVDEICNCVEAMYERIKEDINKVEFLFPLGKKDCKALSSFISIVRNVLIKDEFHKNFSDLKKKFESDEFKKIFDVIEYELHVSKIR